MATVPSPDPMPDQGPIETPQPTSPPSEMPPMPDDVDRPVAVDEPGPKSAAQHSTG